MLDDGRDDHENRISMHANPHRIRTQKSIVKLSTRIVNIILNIVFRTSLQSSDVQSRTDVALGCDNGTRDLEAADAARWRSRQPTR
jgi:hypothetical protein